MAETKEVEQAIKAITTRAAVSREFRTRLLQDPIPAIEAEFNRKVPPGTSIKFIEKDPDVDAMVVLPDLVAPDDRELTPEELEAVAGGVDCNFTCWKYSS